MKRVAEAEPGVLVELVPHVVGVRVAVAVTVTLDVRDVHVAVDR